MKKELDFLLPYLGRVVLFAVMVSLPVVLMYLDIHWLHDDIGEWSLVELTQEGFLLASALAFVRLARSRVEHRRFAVLAAGFFACMLVRELDAVFDLVFHGFWQWVALAIAVPTLVHAARDVKGALIGLVRFLSSRAGTVMTIGLVLLLFYSRLMGMTPLWHGLLGDQYVRVFKNAVEEGTELLGYTFILSASLAYAAQRIHEQSVTLNDAFAGTRTTGGRQL